MKHNSRIAKLLLLLLVAAARGAFAEPSPTILYLINEPASMLDVGLIRMRLWLLHYVAYRPAFEVHGVIADADASYSLDDNQITIALTYLQPLSAPKQTSDLESECRRVIDGVRKGLVWTAIDFPFQHSGYTKKSEPPGLQAEVNTITKITALFMTEAEGGKRGTFQCEGKLNATSISVVK